MHTISTTCSPCDNSSYCKFENVRENFIFAKNIKRHTCICEVENS